MLEARSLTKYYHHVRAVHRVSFTIHPGEILGYLGHNGAGKSTTIKMLTGLMEPSEGQILYQGRSIYEDLTSFQRRLGFVPEEAYLYPHLSGREYLQLVGRLRGMSRSVLEPKIDELLRLLSLWDDRFSALSSYSKGMRQKILLSAALLHNPEVLILDEPFSGLDVTSALMLRRLLDGLAQRQKIVLYSSHVLETVEKVCSKVLILRQGEVVAYDSISQLRELMRQPSLEGVFAQLVDTEDSSELAQQILEVVDDQNAELKLPVRGFPSSAPKMKVAAVRPEISRKLTEPPLRQELSLLPSEGFKEWARNAPRRYAAHLARDIRYGLRMLRRSPGFTTAALLSLSLGICIATCAFSQMNGMTLRRLPGVERPDELVALQVPTSYLDYLRFRTQTDLFSSTAAYVAPVPFDVSPHGAKDRAWGQLVTSSYFSTFGVRPEMGRFFDEQDERSSGTAPVVISYRFWQQHFASDPSVIGTTLRINAQDSTIVGVGPKDFLGASPLLFAADVWLPITVGKQVAPELADNALEQRDRLMFRMVARLRPGVSMVRAENELDGIARQLAKDYGELSPNDKKRRVVLVEGGKLLPLKPEDLPFFTSFLTVVAGLVMLIACSNVANMMLARAANRQKEIAIRMAVGASRGRIVRQLLTESTLIAIGAAIPGFLACIWLMHLLSKLQMPFPIPVTFDFHPDGRVLLLTIVLAAATGLSFGLVPALQATAGNVSPALKGRNVRFRRLRTLAPRNMLLVSQFAGSLTLLVIVGILSLGIQSKMGMRAGFNPENLYVLSLDPVRDGYTPQQTADFFKKSLERVKSIPGVTAATLTETIPVSLADGSVEVNTNPSSDRPTVNAVKHVVGRDYFAATGISVLSGRTFREDDESTQTPAVIVNAELAHEFWSGQDPLGRKIEITADQVVPAKLLPGSYDYRVGSSQQSLQIFQVVGVVDNVAEGIVEEKPKPAMYFPLRKEQYGQPPPSGYTLLLRGLPGIDVISAVRKEVAALDPNISIFNAESMPEQIDRFTAPLRTASWTYALIGIFGLLLASIGLAGMTAYSVTQRGHEIAIRRALGASERSVLRLVMKEGVLLIAIGMSIGLVGEWAGTRILWAMNASVGRVTPTSASDPLVLAGSPLLLAVIALLACYLPARKSMRIDPVAALREE